MNSNGQFTSPGNIQPLRQGRLPQVDLHGQAGLDARHPAQPHLRSGTRTGTACATSRRPPADLYRIDSSRDFGVTVGGPIAAVKNLGNAVQYGNESGTGSETDKYKIWRVEPLRRQRPDRGRGLLQLRQAPERPEPHHGPGHRRLPEQVVQGRRPVSLPTARQANAAGADQKIDIWSAFGYWEFSPKKGDVFFRFDDVKGKLGGVTGGLPEATASTTGS